MMEYRCELLDRPAQPTLVIRTHASVQSLPQVLGEAYGAVLQTAGQMGLRPSGAPFVAYHNMDMTDLDMEIGFPFEQKPNGKDPVLAGEIPGGKAASCLHVGPYEQVGAAYAALQKWMQENACVPAGVVYEFYLNDPETTPPAELQTQVVFPLE
jgi:effector-binding domain-containing protein